MKKIKRQLFSQNKAGFTLIEVVLSLFITLLVVVVLRDSLGLVKKVNQKNNTSNQIAFCYTQLARFLEDDGGFKIVSEKCNQQKIVVQKFDPEFLPEKTTSTNKQPPKKERYKSYTIEQYGSLLRVRGLNSGHMPLLQNIVEVGFKYDEDKFVMKIIEGNNQTSELYFKGNLKEESPDDSKNNSKNSAVKDN